MRERTKGMYSLIVDGIEWIDSEGNASWPVAEALQLMSMLRGMGYGDIEMVDVDSFEAENGAPEWALQDEWDNR